MLLSNCPKATPPFWDKFERANFFLEAIIETVALPTDDRVVAHILSTGVHDGGQWDMFKNLVAKYGIVPKDAMPETAQSENTMLMNRLLNQALKAAAVHIREMAASGSELEQISRYKVSVLDKIYGYLCSCYSEPPRRFDFEYVDKDGHYHIERTIRLKRSLKLTSVLLSVKPFRSSMLRLMTNLITAPILFLCSEMLWAEKRVCYLNLPIAEFKEMIIRQAKKRRTGLVRKRRWKIRKPKRRDLGHRSI